MAVAATSPRMARGRRSFGRDWGIWLGFGALLAIAFAYLVWEGHGDTFFFDDWGWIEQRRTGLHWIFASYNEHLLAVPITLYQLLFRTLGLRHYWIYRLFEVVAHLGCAGVVFEFSRRRIGWYAVPLVAPVVFLGSGWEYVLEPVNFGFVASIALSVGALLALERDNRRGDVMACLLLVLGVACSEFTVVFALGIAVELLWRDKRLGRAWVWAVPLALYAIWWLVYHEPSMAAQNATAAPAFAADLAAGAMGGLFGLSIDWGRPLLLAGLLLAGWGLARPGHLTPRMAMLLVAAAAFWLLVALGRAQGGDPSAPRYIYTGAILIVLLSAEGMRGSALSLRAIAVAGLVALFALAGNINVLRSGADFLRLASSQVASELGALQLARAIVPPDFAVDSHYAPVVFAGPYFAAIDAIGSSPGDSPQRLLRRPEEFRIAADAELARAGELVIGSVAASPLAGSAPTVERALGGSAFTSGPCVRFRSGGSGAALDLLLPPGGLEINAAVGPPVQIRARRFASDFEGNPVATLSGGQTTVVRRRPDPSALAWHLRVSPFQSVRACALG